MVGVGFFIKNFQPGALLIVFDKIHKSAGDVAGLGHGYGKLLHGGLLVLIHGLDGVHLRQHLSGIAQKFLAAGGGVDALGGSFENLNAQAVLQPADV